MTLELDHVLDPDDVSTNPSTGPELQRRGGAPRLPPRRAGRRHGRRRGVPDHAACWRPPGAWRTRVPGRCGRAARLQPDPARLRATRSSSRPATPPGLRAVGHPAHRAATPSSGRAPTPPLSRSNRSACTTTACTTSRSHQAGRATSAVCWWSTTSTPTRATCRPAPAPCRRKSTWTPEMVAKSQAAHGVSVIEVAGARHRRVGRGPLAAQPADHREHPDVVQRARPPGTARPHRRRPGRAAPARHDQQLLARRHALGHLPDLRGELQRLLPGRPGAYTAEQQALTSRYGVGGDRKNWATHDPRFVVTPATRTSRTGLAGSSRSTRSTRTRAR